MNKKYYIVFLWVSFFIPNYFYGQIKISENIQTSSFVKQSENKLYFVDFWATWCAPCLTASKYLESIQSLNPKDFYVVSLSQENPDLVKRFLKKHETGLAVAIDFDGQTFKENNIKSLPYAILYNANGKKLWEGHPANFKPALLDKFLRTNKQRIAVDDMLVKETYKKVETKTKTIEFIDDSFQYSLIDDRVEGSLEIKKNNDIIELTGDLKNIIAYCVNAYVGQIEINDDLNKSYNIKIKYDSNGYANVLDSLIKSFKLQLKTTTKTGEVLELDLQNAKFWDINQIDWGTDNQYQYLIGETEIIADNVSFEEVKYKLSNLINLPINEVTGLRYVKPHDWQIHYKYFELMLANLIDDYGIGVDKKIGKYKNYIITKKTP